MSSFTRMTSQYQTYIWISTRLALCILSGFILETSHSDKMESALFVRLSNFDGFLHTKYKLTNLTAVKSKTVCAQICLQNPECGSFFYLNRSQKMCQTHSVLFMTTNEAVNTSDASYYKLTQSWCPRQNGYILYRPQSLCYKPFRDNISCEGAKLRCMNISNHLLDLKTAEANNHIVNFMTASSNQRNVPILIGGNRVSNVWYWSDNIEMTWTNWEAKGPSKGPKENCLAVEPAIAMKWNNIRCVGNWPVFFICQLNL